MSALQAAALCVFFCLLIQRSPGLRLFRRNPHNAIIVMISSVLHPQAESLQPSPLRSQSLGRTHQLLRFRLRRRSRPPRQGPTFPRCQKQGYFHNLRAEEHWQLEHSLLQPSR